MNARVCVALACLAACHKKTDPSTAAGSGAPLETAGSGAGSAATAATPGSGAGSSAATHPPAQDPGTTLDDTLTKEHVAADAVKKRIGSTTSAWAVVASKLNDTSDVIELEVIGVRADGVAEMHLVPPAGAKGTFDHVVSLEARDLDGDGTDDGVLVVAWMRETRIPGPEKGWFVMTDEQGQQLYVLGGAAPALRVAFTHLVSYKTNSEGLPEENPTPYPDPEEVTYDWSLAPGKPPTAKLTRTKAEIASKDRLKGVLDPASDPLFAAGSGKDLPIALP